MILIPYMQYIHSSASFWYLNDENILILNAFSVNINVVIIIIIIIWLYSPVKWTLASLTTAFHSFLFLALAFQFLRPSLLSSLLRSSIHRFLGQPLFLPLSILAFISFQAFFPTHSFNVPQPSYSQSFDKPNYILMPQ